MKTEKRIRQEIKTLREQLKKILDKGSPDFERVSIREGAISALAWVLRAEK